MNHRTAVNQYAGVQRFIDPLELTEVRLQGVRSTKLTYQVVAFALFLADEYVGGNTQLVEVALFLTISARLFGKQRYLDVHARQQLARTCETRDRREDQRNLTMRRSSSRCHLLAVYDVAYDLSVDQVFEEFSVSTWHVVPSGYEAATALVALRHFAKLRVDGARPGQERIGGRRGCSVINHSTNVLVCWCVDEK